MTAFAFNLVKINGNLLPGVRQPSFQRREKQAVSESDGTIWQTSAPVIRAAPMARFSTVAVRSLFNLMGTATRPPHIALDGVNGLELIGAKINASTPGYDGASVHASRKGALGLIMLSSLTWRPGDVAEATCDAYWRTASGATDPILPATVALPSIPINTEQLVLSSVSTVPAGKILSLDIGIAHQVENNDDMCFDLGLPFPVLLKQPGVGGAVEIQGTIETTDLTSVLSNGVIASTFTVLNHNGVGLSSQTATLTVNSAQIREEEIAGKPSSRRISFRGTWDGTSFPITATTA
jgi:hypothetical protein